MSSGCPVGDGGGQCCFVEQCPVDDVGESSFEDTVAFDPTYGNPALIHGPRDLNVWNLTEAPPP